jgi:hypothetical protein
LSRFEKTLLAENVLRDRFEKVRRMRKLPLVRRSRLVTNKRHDGPDQSTTGLQYSAISLYTTQDKTRLALLDQRVEERHGGH